MKIKIVGIILIVLLCFSLTAVSYSSFGIFKRSFNYELKDVLDADRFIIKKGYWEGYKNNQQIGFVFLSKDWTKNLLGYSGKHIETLIGMDTKGVLTGAKIVAHSEPIVLIGLKEANYRKFMKQYPGKDIMQDLTVGGKISVDAISGATVTAVVQNAIILRSARRVAVQVGIIQSAKAKKRHISKKSISLTWEGLLDSGILKNFKITSDALGIEGEEVYLDLYFGLATPPSIGRNILGDNRFEETLERLKKGESAIFVFANGKGSFKGSGFARGGVFDRFHLEQQERVYFFRDTDYRILTDIKAKGAPEMKEGGLFIVRRNDFDPAGPFRFNLVLPFQHGGIKEFKSFSIDYQIPEMFLEQ